MYFVLRIKYLINMKMVIEEEGLAVKLTTFNEVNWFVDRSSSLSKAPPFYNLFQY